MGLSRTKITLKTIRREKHILSQTGLGKFEKILPNQFYTEKSFMSDKFNIVDYYKTIIRFIRKMLNWNNFYKKLTKVNFEVFLTSFKTKRWTHGPKACCHTLDDHFF